MSNPLVRIPRHFYDRLETLAIERSVTITSLVEEAVANFLLDNPSSQVRSLNKVLDGFKPKTNTQGK